MEVILSMLLVLIPTFIFGWALYAYGQARTTALNGARYAVWERTVWREPGKKDLPPGVAVRSAGEIEGHMVERIFARPGTAIQSTYSPQATNADLPSFYTGHNGDRVIDIERKSNEAKEGEAARPTLKLYDNGEKTSTVASIYNGLSGIMKTLGADGMKLEDKGLYVAEVNLKLNAIRNVKVFEDLNLTISERAAVVTDGWSAGGAVHEKAIVEPMVPMSMLNDGIFGKFFDFFKMPILAFFREAGASGAAGADGTEKALPAGEAARQATDARANEASVPAPTQAAPTQAVNQTNNMNSKRAQ
ncbi:MAG: hypothetical protein LBP86_05960 [Azoarcus sp.]|jgi:hypothetical protein|nr:hypothetical protein [Azoarcus sp.]